MLLVPARLVLRGLVGVVEARGCKGECTKMLPREVWAGEMCMGTTMSCDQEENGQECN